jgi:membrane fusion protein (multidrug efflux system)
MIKRMVIMILLVVVCVGGILGFKQMEKIGTKQGIAAAGIPAQTVSTIKATYADWQPKIEAVGSVRAVNGADLSAEVSGIVDSLKFESGGDVEKDTILVQLRADDDVAKLNALVATQKLAQINYDRDLKQVKVQAISQAVVDNDLATLDNAKAQAAAQQAMLDKKIIKAPFAGHLGLRQVDLGQYLTAGTPIVTLQQLDPIYVDFTLPEQNMTMIAPEQKIVAEVDAYPTVKFEGTITAINSKIDESTRNIKVRATFKNADHKLLPGMFANVILEVGSAAHAITLPQTSITYNPYGNTVYIVDKTDPAKMAVKQQFVSTGDKRGDQVAVLTGVKDGDEVVTSGQVKLRNGMPININNEIQPANDSNPLPADH